MNKLKLLLLAGIALSCTYRVSAQDSTAYKLDELITAYQKMNKFSGAALIAGPNGILLEKGYGYRDLSRNLPNDSLTVFAIASVTKTFTSTLVLELVRESKLSLADKLSKWYPQFPNANRISIAQLLSHTSGIYDYTRSPDHGDLGNEKKMMTFLSKKPLDFLPGSDWRYTNSGYSVLGFIIARVTGMTYEQAVRKYLFAPSSMTRSSLNSNLKDSDQATGYALDDTVRTPVAFADSATVFAAGAIRSTVGDLYRWHQALQANRFAGAALLSQAYTRVQQKYGYGWIIDTIGGKKLVYHSGNIGGFCSLLMRVPEDNICIVLLNNQQGNELEGVGRQLLDVLYHRPYQLPAATVAITLPDSVIKQYIGTYDVPAIHAAIEITVKTGVLVGQIVGTPNTFGFTAEGTNRFSFNDGQVKLEFRINAAGKMEMVIDQNNQKVVGTRRN